MIRCRRCVIPDTRPDTEFIDGVCSACLAFDRRPEIDWDRRKQDLVDLLDRHHGRVMVPSSGGKDSTAQALIMKEMGADVTVVTATTCHLTPIGRQNIDNLARYARTYEVTPNQKTRAALNRIGLEMVGDISWPEHMAIFTTPFRMACDLRLPLILYGENPQAEYGGPTRDSQEARTMTRRWVSEFGGFLGLRPADIAAMGYDMSDYLPPKDATLAHFAVEAHFLGAYLPWDSYRNAMAAIQAGMRFALPCPANYWEWENLDNAQTGIHDHMMYRKYGYGRGAAQISVDIRNGLITREKALAWVLEHDGLFPIQYAGVHINDVLHRLEISREHLEAIMDRYTNWDLFNAGGDELGLVPEKF